MTPATKEAANCGGDQCEMAAKIMIPHIVKARIIEIVTLVR